MENYSVLMSVYYKEKAEFLRASIKSMLDQTVPPDDFVIVCDGSLTAELDKTINEFCSQKPTLFQIVRSEKNVGIGAAANLGLKYCKNDLVAKMDSDDISRPDRCERQLKVFRQIPELAIVGGQLSEFEDTPEHVVAIRKVPLNHEDILTFSKRRMPFNNQTVMYRKQAVFEAGGYSPLKRCEDYDLYVRMLQLDYDAKNLPCVLVDYRLNQGAMSRRGTVENFKGFFQVRWKIYKSGYSSFIDFIFPCLGQVVVSLIPNRLKYEFYKKFLR